MSDIRGTITATPLIKGSVTLSVIPDAGIQAKDGRFILTKGGKRIKTKQS